MLINRRNALMAGKRLPYDAEVEYLESSGTQFIDTGVIPTTDLEFELHVKFSALLTTTGQVPMGFRYVQGLQWRYMVSNYPYLGTSTTYSYASFFNNQRCYAAKVGTLEYVFSLKNGVFSNGIGNNTQVSMSGTPPITPIPDNWTIYLFKGNQINEGSDPFTGRIYSLKFWRNGVLVRDFIPVRKGTVGYLYDRVSGKLFGNAGTGDFVLGQDVVPVEYIESHGTEWIDTGVTPDFNLSMSATLCRTDTTAGFLFGARQTNATNSFCLASFSTYARFDFGGNDSAQGQTKISPICDGKMHTISVAYPTITVDGTTGNMTPVSSFSLNQNIVLFANNTNGSITKYSGVRIAALRLYSNGVLVRDYQPVRVGSGSTWEGAMMDVLTRRIYRNAGTGAFSYGNDLKYPIPSE